MFKGEPAQERGMCKVRAHLWCDAEQTAIQAHAPRATTRVVQEESEAALKTLVQLWSQRQQQQFEVQK